MSRFAIRIWGCRGSLPRCAPGQEVHGGNTTCLEILHDGTERILIDAGSGIANYGDACMASGEAVCRFVLVFTHYHWDHICGLPFFAPLYSPNANVAIYGEGGEQGACGRSVSDVFSPAFSPIYTPAHLGCTLSYHDVSAPFGVGDLRLEALHLPAAHPGGVCLWRVSGPDASVVIATDIELSEPGVTEAIVGFAAGTDLLVVDCQYDDAQYPLKKGWGHETLGNMVELAAECGVGRVLGTHHDPFRDDADIEVLAAEVRRRFPQIRVDTAREGEEVPI